MLVEKKELILSEKKICSILNTYFGLLEYVDVASTNNNCFKVLMQL